MGYLKRLAQLLSLGAIAAVMAVTPASAGDYNGDFMIRLQGTGVFTQDDLRHLDSASLGDLKALGFDAKVSDRFIPTATLSYFLNKNFAVELFCCFSKHSVDLKTPAGFGALQGEVAQAWLFPPILTLQYHFTNFGRFKPYVGAGIQYIHFFREKTGRNTLGAGDVDFEDSWGPALQAGFDLEIGRGWYLNADIKKSFLDTKVKWRYALGGGDTIIAKDDLDPLTVSVGVGYRFNLFGSVADSQPMK
ncbi:MAG: OmpW/AlkL family protein [Hyphomicrobiaceae bacterium]